MQPSLFDRQDDELPDQSARDVAKDPTRHVVLEASAGTGKTRVLVDRYVRLIRSGIPPRHILAITFTRKAAAEMRERILAELREDTAAAVLADIQIATIDAFCFGLLREFPLEAAVDPGFEIADETEMARFATEALDVTMRLARGVVVRDETVRLLFTKVKPQALHSVLATLLDRRQVALPAVATFVKQKVKVTSVTEASEAFVARVRRVFAASDDFADTGPQGLPEFRWVVADAERLVRDEAFPVADVPQLQRRLERYFLTKKGEARKRLPGVVKDYPSPDVRKRHESAFQVMAPEVDAAIRALERDVDGLLARGLLTVLTIAVKQYERLLEEHAVLDFAGMLDRSVALLERQEEFARSRLKLQSRYHHLLVDEFQDTSRRQWRLIDLLIEAWGEGEGVADGRNSIFIVGDRKQSIYRFRHAEVELLDEAARRIAALRPGRHGQNVRQAISTNFRAVAELLAFVNMLASGMEGDPDLPERFSYADHDRFPVAVVGADARRDGRPVLGIAATVSLQASAEAVATEIARILREMTVRDRHGPPRPARPDDVAILFRARAGHQVFEEALERRGIRTYVYKGLGFFDAPEVQDLQALLRFFAQPESNLRTAEFLRSRFVRLSDGALAALAPELSAALIGPEPPATVLETLTDIDRQLLRCARQGAARWLALADRIPPGALIDQVLRESAYAVETAGPRAQQARENVKKVRTLVRRVESRGYTTIGRLAEYFETLRAGDESNAAIEARGCVNLMTIHAAKGLEYPVVFVVNLHAPGRGGSQGVSVIDRSVDDLPEVAFRSTDGTRLEERRELEELRRLLYVAVTRARDALVLVGEVDDNAVLRAPKRSLAGLLPLSLRQAFTRAAVTDDEEVRWEAGGQAFAVRVCRAAAATTEDDPPAPDATEDTAVTAVDRQPLVGFGPTVRAATTDDSVDPDLTLPAHQDHEDRPAGRGRGADADRHRDRLAGTLVHRAMQYGGPQPDSATTDRRGAVIDRLRRLTRMEELVDIPDTDAFFAAVAADHERLSRRADVQAWLGEGEAFYEVPFSFASVDDPETVIRGSIDCLIVGADGAMRVLEFKTGRPRPEHARQLETYVAAVRARFPNREVHAELVYAGAGD